MILFDVSLINLTHVFILDDNFVNKLTLFYVSINLTHFVILDDNFVKKMTLFDVSQ